MRTRQGILVFNSCVWHAGAQYGSINCVAYPREHMRPKDKPIEPFSDPEWYKELDEAKSRPVGLTQIIPQVCFLVYILYKCLHASRAFAVFGAVHLCLTVFLLCRVPQSWAVSLYPLLCCVCYVRYCPSWNEQQQKVK